DGQKIVSGDGLAPERGDGPVHQRSESRLRAVETPHDIAKLLRIVKRAQIAYQGGVHGRWSRGLAIPPVGRLRRQGKSPSGGGIGDGFHEDGEQWPCKEHGEEDHHRRYENKSAGMAPFAVHGMMTQQSDVEKEATMQASRGQSPMRRSVRATRLKPLPS